MEQERAKELCVSPNEAGQLKLCDRWEDAEEIPMSQSANDSETKISFKYCVTSKHYSEQAFVSSIQQDVTQDYAVAEIAK